MHRPIVRTGLGLFAALTLAVTGCAVDPTEIADPRLALAASTETLEQESFRFEMTMGDSMNATGAVDPAAETGTVAMSIAAGGMEMDFETIIVGTEMWTNLGELGGLVGVETDWLHIDQTRLGEDGFAGVEPGELDLVGAAEMLKGLGTVEQVDANTFRGEIEVTRGESTVFADEMLKALGEDSITLDFVATVDDQDRLTELVVELPPIPQLPAKELELRYFDFGSPVEVSPPPADQVTELPEAFYDMFS
jgi:hypothetical protein